MDAVEVSQVRSFNRLVTERVGALNDHFLGRDRSLGESRLLWEIGDDGVEIRQLRRRLGLDSAYMSRLLRSLEHQALVTTTVSPVDARVRRVELTKAGRAERAELDRLSDEFAQSVLRPLTGKQRSELTSAMKLVERLLIASMVQVVVADPQSPEAEWCFQQYFAELAERFNTGFDPALSISADANELIPPAGGC